MTAWTEKEFDEYMRKVLPVMFAGNGVTVGADIELKCWYAHSVKYRVDWFWKGKTFQVCDNNANTTKILFASPICGDLSLFCHMDDGAVLYCDAETFDAFVDRLLGLRAFE